MIMLADMCDCIVTLAPMVEWEKQGHPCSRSSQQAVNELSLRGPACLQELVVRVKLPGLKQASQAQLNVTPRHLTVSVPGKHHLQLNLPYAVAETEGSASFNPVKQQLEVTLPVVPPKAPAMTSAQPTPDQQGQTDAMAGPSDSDQSKSHTEGKQQPTETVTPASTSDAAAGSTSTAQQSESLAQAARTGDGSSTAADESHQAAQPQDEATAAGSGSQAPAKEQQQLTQNQRRWLELHQPAANSAAVDQDQAVAQSAKSQATEETADMEAVQQAAAAGEADV